LNFYPGNRRLRFIKNYKVIRLDVCDGYSEKINKKFLEVSEPFYKKVLTRRRQKLMVDLGEPPVEI
jgi:hypothetical protein